MTTNYVISHKACHDGHGAAWAAWRKLGWTDTKYKSMHYGDPVPEFKPNSKIYIVDFSLPRAELIKLAEDGHQVVVRDHHKSAKEDLEDLIHPNLDIVFDMEKSGARMAWEYFHPETPVPYMILTIEDRDLWRFARPDTKAIRCALEMLDWKFDTWSQFADDLEDESKRRDIVNRGSSVLAYQEKVARGAAEKSFLVQIGEHKVRCSNATSVISETGNMICDIFPDSPYSITFFVQEGSWYVYSLRSRGDFDVSQVARVFGGGGHAAASGFKVNHPPEFLSVLYEKATNEVETHA